MLSVPWRHLLEVTDAAAAHSAQNNGTGAILLSAVMRYDKARQGIHGPERYRVDIYRNHVASLTSGDAEATLRARRVFTYSQLVP